MPVRLAPERRVEGPALAWELEGPDGYQAVKAKEQALISPGRTIVAASKTLTAVFENRGVPNFPTRCSGLMLVLCTGPEGAAECSYGWSAAEPVDKFDTAGWSPEGATEFQYRSARTTTPPPRGRSAWCTAA